MKTKKIKIKDRWKLIGGSVKGNESTWQLTTMYCTHCGKQAVWTLPDSEVDYGGGDCHVCQECGTVFYGYESGTDDEIKGKLRE